MTEQTQTEKIIFSGIKPTGSLTLGNYIGAVKNWQDMAKKYRCFFMVADSHAITVENVPSELRARSLDIFAMYIALGLSNENTVLFMQSHVPAHAELTWVLNCFTSFGEARRMTQFKDKSLKNPENVNVGLFDYPVLMAADILLYNADYVPIGKDQQQHLELARVIAQRFNHRFSPTFTVPEGFYPKYGAKVYSLSDPTAKMGKTEGGNADGCVYMLDDADTVRRKFKRAVTDSETAVKFDPKNKAGVSNLLTVYAAVADTDIKSAERFFENKSYAFLKETVADAVIAALSPVQKRFYEVRNDKAYLAEQLKKGAESANGAARKTLGKVYKKVGFVEK